MRTQRRLVVLVSVVMAIALSLVLPSLAASADGPTPGDGADVGFFPPTVTTNAATAVGATSSTLNGTVNAEGDTATVTFEYGTTIAYGTTVTADQSPVTGSSDTAVSKAITGLTNNTTYHYRVVGENINGTTYGNDLTFCTGVCATTTGLDSWPNPSTLGQSVTFTATVTSDGGTPTGTVTFFYSGMVLGIGALDGSGVGTYTMSSLSPLIHPITATYGGDVSFLPSTSGVLLQTVVCEDAVTVTSAADAGPGSLRDALDRICPGGIIDFDLPYPATIVLTSGELSVDRAVTIQGPGSDLLAVSGNKVSGVISATQPITISGVTMRDGYAADCGGAVYADSMVVLTDCRIIDNAADLAGGGVCAPEVLVYGCAFEGNQAPTAGGLTAEFASIIESTFISNTASVDYAGAAYVLVMAEVFDSTFQGNQAEIDAGAIEVDGMGIVSGCQFIDNQSLTGDGGALLYTGYMFAPDSTLSLKAQAEDATPSWGQRDRDLTPSWAADWETSSATLASLAGDYIIYPYFFGVGVVASHFDGNTSAGIGGGICADPYAPTWVLSTTLSNNAAVYAGGGAAVASASIISTTSFVSNVVTDEYGAGGGLYLGAFPWWLVVNTGVESDDPFLWPTSVQACRFEGNHSADMGGGLYIDGSLLQAVGLDGDDPDFVIFESMPVVISDTSIISNTCAYGGAGLVCDYAELHLVDSTVAGNVTQGVIYDGDEYGTGGGIQLMDMPYAYLTNVTIVNNRALGQDDDGGGGMMVYAFGPDPTLVSLSHVTIVGNHTASMSDWGTGGGGISQYGDAIDALARSSESRSLVVMTNTLVAGNTSAAGIPDLTGPATLDGGNIIGDDTGSLLQVTPGDLVGTAQDPVVALTGPLGNYGGKTETLPLLPGSIAIDFCTAMAGLPTDQRGVARDVYPDTGAFESRGFGLVVGGGSPQREAILAEFGEPLAASVTSAYGEPVDGGIVNFDAPALGASAALVPTNPVTIAGGVASVMATANDTAGSYLVQAEIPVWAFSPVLVGEIGTIAFDLTNLPVSGQAALSGGPAEVCPGYNVYYNMEVTNTSPEANMYGLVVTGTVPADTEFYGDMTPAGTYNAAKGEIVWSVPALAAGASASFDWSVHTFSGRPDGSTITGNASWSSQALAGDTQTMTVTIDSSKCAPPDPLTITGVVYGSQLGASSRDGLSADQTIAGAVVTATTCVAGEWTAVTDADGAYEIVIPGQVADACAEVTLDVHADGYGDAGGVWSVQDLRLDGRRDFYLLPSEKYIYLPLNWK